MITPSQTFKQIMIAATVFVYLSFVLLKSGSIHLMSSDAFEVPVDLVDWNDDRIFQDKEFVAEINIFKSVIMTVFLPKAGADPKAVFFYNKIYKEIKISIITPPPKIG